MTGPVEGAAVVINGRKYRIRAIEDDKARCAEAGPHWRTAPIVVWAWVPSLVFDYRAGVWRAKRAHQ